MELNGEFFVKAAIDEAWQILTDVERVAPCLPGAELREVDGDEYRGVIRVKAGQVSTEYRGSASLVEADPKKRRAVLRLEGREARGRGSTVATVTAVLSAAGDRTRVSLTGDANVTGKLGQLGADALADLCAELLAGFSDNLEQLLAPARRPRRRAVRAEHAEDAAGAAAGPAAEAAHADQAAHAGHAGHADQAAEADQADQVDRHEQAEPEKTSAPAASESSDKQRRAAASRPEPGRTPAEGGSNGSAGQVPSHNGTGRKGRQGAGTATVASAVEAAVDGGGVSSHEDGGLAQRSESGASTDADFESAMDDLTDAEVGGRSALVVRIVAIAGAAIALALIAAWLRRRLR